VSMGKKSDGTTSDSSIPGRVEAEAPWAPCLCPALRVGWELGSRQIGPP
jgi:hypothetical protein